VATGLIPDKIDHVGYHPFPVEEPAMRAIAIVLAALLTVAAAAAADIATEVVTYDHDGVILEGFLAEDSAANGKAPGVLVIHQWRGLTDNETLRAEMLAELGYVALAADVYGQGVHPKNSDEAREQAVKYYSDRELFRARLAAGLAKLKAHPKVDPDRVAVIGYCFGGAAALELARSGADLAGAVSFHGNLDTPLPAGPGDVKGKVLVCHGAIDHFIKPEHITGFVDEMEGAGVDYQFIMYAGAVHAFTQKSAGDDPSRGVAYNEAADRRSWQHMKDFFAEIFE